MDTLQVERDDNSLILVVNCCLFGTCQTRGAGEKHVVLVMFNGWASPCCELFIGAGPNLFCFVVIAKNWRFPRWWSDFLEFVCENWNWIPFFRTCSLYWCPFEFSFKRPCFLVDGNVKTRNISAFQMEDAVVSLLVFELLKGGRY